jgi:fermentation-respiration switch protein FrsA (DUF1100 family)
MTRAIKRKVYWTSAVVLIGMVASVFLVGWYASEKVIHPDLEVSPYNPSQFDLPLENVRFLSRDGFKLAGWFIPGTSGATVILAHGRGSERSWMLPNANYLHNEGFSVLLFDFRYRGESEGDAQTLGAKEAWDIQSAVDYLKNRSDIDAERIGVQGISMGAASAILAAAETPEIKGVVAEIPFTSVNDILSHTFPIEVGLPSFPFAPATKFICELRTGVDFDGVAPIEAIVRISPRPVFLIDNSEDHLFPCDSVETLYKAAKEPKVLWQVPGAAHGEGWETAPKEYERRVLAFWGHTFGTGHLEKSGNKNVED